MLRFWQWYGEAGYYLPEEKPRWYPAWLNEWFGRQTNMPPWQVWRIRCLMLGHHTIDDHCGKPEHQYCIVCGKRTPYATR